MKFPKGSLIVALIAYIIGAGVSAYLLNHHYEILNGDASFHSFCSINSTFDCDLVNTSKYSEILGIPLAAWALSFYLTAILLTSGAAFGFVSPDNALAVMIPLSGASVLASLTTFGISAVVLKKFCLMCSTLQLMNIVGFTAILLAKKKLHRALAYSHSRTAQLVALGIAILVAITLAGQSMAKPFPLDEEEFANKFRAETALMVDVGQSPRLGFQGDNPPVRLVEFSDFRCPFCRMAAKQMHRLLSLYGDKIQLVFKNFPLDPSCNPHVPRSVHQNACEAAKASICAQAQGKFVELYEILFENQETISPTNIEAWAKEIKLDMAAFDSCIHSQETQERILVDANMGNLFGIGSTPTFFVNGRRVEGALDEARLKVLMRELGVK